MYSPANRVFLFSKCGRGGPILIMCTQCTQSTLQLTETNTFYTQRILGVIIIIAMIKENDNYKVMFYFLSHNVLLLFILKIAL